MKHSVLILFIIALIAIIKVSAATQSRKPRVGCHNKASTNDNINKSVKDYFFTLPKNKQIAGHFVRDEKQLPETLQPYFKGVSIQDYIDHGEKPVINDRWQLDLSYMHINDLSGLEHIDNIASLLVLVLHHNRLESITPADVKHIPNLVILSLHDNNISTIALSSNLPKLTMLYLYNNNIRTLTSLGDLPNLHELTLDHNHISSITSGALHNLRNLRGLYLQNNAIREIPLGVFDNLSALQELYIQNNPIAHNIAEQKRIEQEVRNATGGRGHITWHK